jgi:hypothetical protein
VNRGPELDPAALFEATPPLNFGQAYGAVRAGRHITRESWEPTAFVTAQAGYPEGIGVNTNTAQATGLAQGSRAAFGPYLMRCSGRLAGVTPAFVPWTPGQEDLFADDWRLLADRPQG